jgi:Ca2+-dependent lipid-binding protein
MMKLINSFLLRPRKFVGKADPYCIVKHGTSTYKTAVKSNAGKNPHFNEKFEMRAERFNPVYIECWDQDTLSDDLIGIDISSFMIDISSVLT